MDKEQRVHDIAIAILNNAIIPNMNAQKDYMWDKDAFGVVASEYQSILEVLNKRELG